jgi:hypothetical protein
MALFICNGTAYQDELHALIGLLADSRSGDEHRGDETCFRDWAEAH